MNGIVLELQQDALNKEVNVSDLARKALAVSKKLSLGQIEQWLDKELYGYDDEDTLPLYRIVHGEIKVKNPYHGWQPVVWEDTKTAEQFSEFDVRIPLGELDTLISRESNQAIMSYLPPELTKYLLENMRIPLTPALIIQQSEIVGVLDAVRNNILNWALELEKEGIIGEGMSFSNQEKEKAGNVSHQIIYNIGSMSNSQLQHDSPGAKQVLTIQQNMQGIIEELNKIKASINDLGLSDLHKNELIAEIATIESQSQSPRPKQPIIKECLTTIRDILVGATGNVIASGLLENIGKFI
jgi:hypothetical protein